MKVLILALILFPSAAFSQDHLQQLVDNLKYVNEMPGPSHEDGGACGDKRFWKVVQQKLKAVPFLIDKISDSTQTSIHVYMFGANWTVGEIAYAAIEEIIHEVPTFELLGVPFDTHGCGYCSYWQHLRKDLANRKKFQQAVSSWYADSQKKLVWVPNVKVENPRCKESLSSGGHYELVLKK